MGSGRGAPAKGWGGDTARRRFIGGGRGSFVARPPSFRHAVVTEVAPAPFRGERFSRKVRREALQPEKLEERLPRPALAVDEQIFEGDCMYERVALREAECPREARPCGRPVTIITGGRSSTATAAAIRRTHAQMRRILTINDVQRVATSCVDRVKLLCRGFHDNAGGRQSQK